MFADKEAQEEPCEETNERVHGLVPAREAKNYRNDPR